MVALCEILQAVTVIAFIDVLLVWSPEILNILSLQANRSFLLVVKYDTYFQEVIFCVYICS